MSPSRMGAPSRAAPPAPSRHRWRAAWWLLPVLLLHLAVLWGLARAMREPVPHALPPALYTRVLLPQAPQPAAPGTAPARAAGPAAAQTTNPQLLQAPRNAPTPAPRARPASAPLPHAASEPGAEAAKSAGAAANQTARHAARPGLPAAAASKPAGQAPAAPARASSAPRAVRSASTPSTAPAASTPTSTPTSAPTSAPASTPSTAPGATGTPGRSAAAAAADAWPVSTRLDYALTGFYRGPLHGNGELEWRRDARRYELRLGGSALVDFSYTSTGTIDGDWLAPDDYVEQVLMRSKTVRFDRAAGLLRFSAIGSTMPIPAHLLDSASVFMQLAQDLRTRPAEFHAGAHLRFQVARPSGTTIWDFLVTGREPVDTGAGRLDTWHLEYQPPARDDLGAEVWLAPSLQGLPVQIRLRHDGDDFLLFTLRRALQQAPAGEARAGTPAR